MPVQLEEVTVALGPKSGSSSTQPERGGEPAEDEISEHDRPSKTRRTISIRKSGRNPRDRLERYNLIVRSSSVISFRSVPSRLDQRIPSDRPKRFDWCNMALYVPIPDRVAVLENKSGDWY